MGVPVGYPVLLSLLWTIQGTLSYHGTPERDESQTELVGESDCAFETNHDRGSSTWVDFASALAEGPGAARAPDYNSSGFVFMLVAICFTALIVPPARRALILVTTTGPRLVAGRPQVD